MKKYTLLALVAFTPVAIVAVLLNQSNFAIGDDYHALGFYFVMGGMSFPAAIANYWSSPYMAGRPFAALAELYPLSLMDSINQLVWVRYFHIIMLAAIFFLLLRIALKCNCSRFHAVVIALFMFTIPGVWHLYLMDYGTSMLSGIISMLLGALVTISHSRLSYKQWMLFSLCATFSIFSYQPAWPLLFIGLVGKTLSKLSGSNLMQKYKTDTENIISRGRFDVQNNSENFVKALAIVLSLFVLNFLLVKFGYNSTRLSANVDWLGKFKYVLDDLLPTTVYPWLYIWFPGQSWVKYLSLATYATSAIVILFYLFWSVKVRRVDNAKINWAVLIFIISIATSLLPLTLGMFLFTDQAISFRRVLFASMFFWFTLLIFWASVIRFSRNKNISYILNCVTLSCIIMYIFAFGYFVHVGTVQLASREWNAAVCASKLAPLTEPVSVNTKIAILEKPFPSALRNEEFQTSTFSYPTGGMLVWLAHFEANRSIPEFNRWNVELKDNLTLTEWDSAYLNCLNIEKP